MIKIYIDTSVIIALADVDDEFHDSSVRFLRYLLNRGIATAIGPPFLLEVAKTTELRDSQAALRLVRTIEEHEIEVTETLSWLWNLADEYLARGVLGSGRLMDLLHYASATLLKCTHLASWDREHFNTGIGTKINLVNSSAGLASLIVGDPIRITRHLGLG